ncbi:cache domain-containing sensor histidine kinase [Paenibacillus aceris]|uniref:histidine kinase n=1 Tax=Paenibacillus aceris TaxID=869555 RepID=A0ABS4I3D5_9BACL|nr:sensor histidine kinase [Paenibacillus aceris]MBP1964941.1 two-component system sensor histidine kinase YesM [Paenibacillus aceris]NHW35602.1 histidine kinase [Paenibacillus aceris]
MIFQNMSFRTKMFMSMTIVILIPMIIVSSLLYIRSAQSITDQTSKVVISSIDFAVNNIDSALDNVTGLSKLILTDSRLLTLAKQETRLPLEVRNEKYVGMLDLLNFFITRIRIQNVLEGTDSFYLYLVKQNTIIDSKSTYYEDVNSENIDFVKKSFNTDGNEHWFVSTPVDYYSLNRISTRLEESKLITFNRVLKDEKGDTIAVLAVNVRDNYISDYYRKIQRGIPGDFVVMDADSKVVAHTDQSIVGKETDLYSQINDKIQASAKESGSFFVDMQKQFVVYSISPYNHWRYVVVIPSSEILGKVYEIRNFFIILISITALILFIVSYFLSNLFYKPLLKLIRAMQKIENRNLEVRIQDKRQDEFRQVYQGFNDMADELKALVKDLANEKLYKLEAEIKLLQAQINPHFLYNTLDSIYSIAKIKKVEEISQMVAALSKFFRVSLSGGRDIVSLKEAVSLVVNYLTILNIRYRGEISYHIDLPDEFADCLVPKMLLQPIVENSVYHGIERTKGRGHIYVAVSSNEGKLRIVVNDNGIGMQEEELRRLRDSLHAEAVEGSSFALRNLVQQIRLKYGPCYGIDIESTYGEGTQVMIELPITTSEVLAT